MQQAIAATLMRGGTSKGLYLDARDLPQDDSTRDAVLLALMGSPDARQIDGLGGAHPLTSKIAILSPPSRPDADIDYLFLQVSVDQAQVSDGQNCGNILAGVGPWAIESGLVAVQQSPTDAAGTTPVRVHMLNTGGMAIASVPVVNGQVCYSGDAQIDGVPGTAAGIELNFLELAGSTCGALLPTGNSIDIVDGLELTCIDNGMPVVLLRAADLGCSGYETPAELEADLELKARIEKIRLALGERMNLGDVSDRTVPKMCLLAPPRDGGVVCTRMFIPHRVHEAIGVLAAVSVATACAMGETVADAVAAASDHSQLAVEHPSGYFTVAMKIEGRGATCKIHKSALLRTARKLFAGDVFLPPGIWSQS